MKQLITPFSAVLSSLTHRITIDTDRPRATVDSTHFSAGSIPELRAELSATIYNHLHLKNPEIANIPATGEQDLEAHLKEGLPHKFSPQQAEPTKSPEVLVNGATHESLRITGVKVLVPKDQAIKNPEGVTYGANLPSWRENTTPGFFLSFSEEGQLDRSRISRLYINCETAQEALTYWPQILESLAQNKIVYQAKILSSSAAYPRSDAIVIYTDDSQEETATSLVGNILQSEDTPKTPPSIFSRHLTERLSTATEPNDLRPSYRGLSFGQHRSRVLAEALLEATTARQPLAEVWAHRAEEAHINPASPYLNHPTA